MRGGLCGVSKWPSAASYAGVRRLVRSGRAWLGSCPWAVSCRTCDLADGKLFVLKKARAGGVLDMAVPWMGGRPRKRGRRPQFDGPAAWPPVGLARMRLEDALAELVAACLGSDKRRLRALLRRLGFDGEPPATLQEAGDLMGVTRERMRQIEDIFGARLPPFVQLPQLDAAIHVIEDLVPCSFDDAMAALLDAGLTERPFHPSSVVEAAARLGRAIKVELDESADRVRRPGFGAIAPIIRSAASWQSQASGVGTVEGLVEELRSRRVKTDVETARECLATSADFVCLDADWFWYCAAPPGNNRLENVTRKILAAAGRAVSIDAIHGGLERQFPTRRRRANSRRRRALALIVPPPEILRMFYKAHPEFSVGAADRVRARGPRDPGAALGPSERVLADAIARAGGVASSRALEEACRASGMNVHTVRQMLYASPIFMSTGHALWKVRGAAAGGPGS